MSRLQKATTLPKNILILGASARAAAFSAWRMKLQTIAIDLFADADLQSMTSCYQIKNYSDIPAQVDQIQASASPADAWLYTGALENHPQILETVSSKIPLLGNTPQTLRFVRDPFACQAFYQENRFHYPQTAKQLPSINLQTVWLQKPFQSAGGMHISIVDAETNHSCCDPGKYYFQEKIPGEACAALYIANGKDCQFLGATKQLLGKELLDNKSDNQNLDDAFCYQGSIGPLANIPPATLQELVRLGSTLTQQCQLTGLFGIDFIWQKTTRPSKIWPIEINPRYTASAEILEWAYQYPLIKWHLEATVLGKLPQVSLTQTHMATYYGKQILFTPWPIRWQTPGPPSWSYPFHPLSWPELADFPTDGTLIEKGRPVLTLFVQGTNFDQVKKRLKQKQLSLLSKLNHVTCVTH